MQTDIIIIGSGFAAKITGLTLALKGFEVLMIPNRINGNTASNLVTFLSSGSIKFLKNILDNSSVLESYESMIQIHCSPEEELKNRSPNLYFKNDGGKILGRIIPNTKIEELLDQKINTLQNIQILKDEEVDTLKLHENKIEIKTRSSLLYEAKLFIAADGKNSIIKNFTNIEFVQYDFHQTAISIIADIDRKEKNTAYQFFMTDGPLALLPCNSTQSAIVWSLKNKSEILLLNQKQLELKLSEIFEPFVSKMKIINQQKFNLSFSFGKKLFSTRSALVGDTAHSIHPIAGQGLNLIIKDIDCLSSLLKKYQRLGYDIGDQIILEEYNNLRKIDNTAYAFGTLAIEELFSMENNFVRSLTSSALKLFNQSDRIKRSIIHNATGEHYFNNL